MPRTRGPVRRAQLIAPFGPGAMQVLRDGTSVICCGLDHWFEREEGSTTNIDRREFVLNEWRLAARLGVDEFYTPPEYRRPRRGDDTPNALLTVPHLRFPRWHYCPSCGFMQEAPLERRGAIECDDCARRSRRVFLVQVPFVAMCEAGHIRDFPWREWVYRSASPPVDGPPMRLVATGGLTLAGQLVKVDGGPQRNLAGITSARPDGNTDLSNLLDGSGTPYLCEGSTPWLGAIKDRECGQPLRGSLRSAANVYFAQVRSAIYLPRGEDSTVSEVITILERPPTSTLISILQQSGVKPTAEQLRQHSEVALAPFSDAQISEAIGVLIGTGTTRRQDIVVGGDDAETRFRRQEYNTLRESRSEPHLTIQRVPLDEYDEDIRRYFRCICVVPQLRETRALVGFTRVFPDQNRNPAGLRSLLRKTGSNETWLPAYEVFGEGIYLEISEDALNTWLAAQATTFEERINALSTRYNDMAAARQLLPRLISARFVLLHSLSHLLMNRLTFECGYSSAALRERLYVSDSEDAPMSGILIYTAAGDAEGTLGGLVRMGRPGKFEPVLRRAVRDSSWCSLDPVCMEMGAGGGQGPDSLNLAACHSCCLVPETACEEFNRLLDRGVIVGTVDDRETGFFADIAS